MIVYARICLPFIQFFVSYFAMAIATLAKRENCQNWKQCRQTITESYSFLKLCIIIGLSYTIDM